MYGKETGKNIFERDSSQQKVCDFLSFENNVPFLSSFYFLFCCQIIVIKMKRYQSKWKTVFCHEINKIGRPGQAKTGLTCRGLKGKNTFKGLGSPVWPDWAIYSTLGNFLKPLATIILPKSPTFLGNFYKGVKIFDFLWNHFGQFLWTFGDFLLVTLLGTGLGCYPRWTADPLKLGTVWSPELSWRIILKTILG